MGSTLSGSLPAIELPPLEHAQPRPLEKIQAAREYDFAPMFALSSDWEKNFLAPSMARSTAEAFNIVRCLDHSGKLDDSPQDKRQNVATALLRDKLLAQNFAGPISLRASRILGPVSRFRVAEILHLMKLASGASCPGLAVGFLRIICKGLCMSFCMIKDFTSREKNECVELVAQMSLTVSHNNECPLLYNLVASIW